MPREPAKEAPQPHREKDIDHLRSGCFTTIEEMKWAMGYVCLPMEPREWKKIPEAMKAVEEEYAKLRKRGAWDEKIVKEWRTVVAESKRRRKKEGRENDPGPLVGSVFPLCGVKNHEIAHVRKYKGRVVFQGNYITDKYGTQTFFPDQGSGASFMTASRLADAIALLPGCSGQQSDAPQACTQTKLGKGLEESHRETWVRLPRNMWPPEWAGMSAPVCPLVLALYGHPLSGTHWENYYDEIVVQKCGFEKVVGWESLYAHRALKVFLPVYVDDFKLAGETKNLPKAWKLMTDNELLLDPPEPLGQYLGCRQRPTTLSKEELDRRMEHIRPLYHSKGYKEKSSQPNGGEQTESGKNLRDTSVDSGEGSKLDAKSIRYDVESFFESC
ncbi:MAG: hypothetical protein QF745_08200, partial [Planctomycetota bacterium]|nr:hypothetical protein [Planctomycetota bacterium]